MVRMRGGTRRGFLCPATLLPMLMLALSINQMIRPLEAARLCSPLFDNYFLNVLIPGNLTTMPTLKTMILLSLTLRMKLTRA